MDKYLLEILKNVNTIIIPGLGALTITNHDTGEIMFMPYLQHDDGKLSSYIAENEGMEEVDAKNLIAKYVREITARLDQGDTYDMYQFGSFKKDDSGDVLFMNWEAEVATTPELGIEEEKTSATVESIQHNDEVKEEPSIAATDEIVLPEVTPLEEVTSVFVEEEIQEAHPEALSLTPEIKEDLREESPISKKEMNIAEKEEVQRNQEKLARLRHQQENKVEKRKRGAGFYMLVSLIGIMIVGGVFVGINFNEIKQHIPFLADSKEIKDEPSPLDEMKDIMGLNEEDAKSEEDTMEIPVENEDEIKSDDNEVQPETELLEEKTETPITKPSNSTSSNGDYHVIAGAFSNEANANRLGEKLRFEGYSVRIGKGNGMNLVSIKSFSTKEEAQKNLSELKIAAPQAWIFYWPN